MDDNRRLCEFLYRNLGAITQIVPTLDTHRAMQIFHPIWLVDADGRHPAPYTLVTATTSSGAAGASIPAAVESTGFEADYAERQLVHYTRARRGRQVQPDDLAVPRAARRIGHALVRGRGGDLLPHDRALQPAGLRGQGREPADRALLDPRPGGHGGPDGEPIAGENDALIEELLQFDAVIVAGQAKSHCVAWTIDDLLEGDDERERRAGAAHVPARGLHLAGRRAGVADYTDEADAAFSGFAAAGMHVVRSTEPIEGAGREPAPGFR